MKVTKKIRGYFFGHTLYINVYKDATIQGMTKKWLNCITANLLSMYTWMKS